VQLVAPVVDEYDPGAHATGSAVVVAQEKPSGHTVQVAWYCKEYDPALQGVTAVVVQEEPAGQAWQVF